MNDNVIPFPGSGAQARGRHKDDQISSPGSGLTGVKGLTADQEKALGLAADGMSFVMVGIKPTASGADFFTAVHGKRSEVAQAAPHLDAVIQRALRRLDVL